MSRRQKLGLSGTGFASKVPRDFADRTAKSRRRGMKRWWIFGGGKMGTCRSCRCSRAFCNNHWVIAGNRWKDQLVGQTLGSKNMWQRPLKVYLRTSNSSQPPLCIASESLAMLGADRPVRACAHHHGGKGRGGEDPLGCVNKSSSLITQD